MEEIERLVLVERIRKAAKQKGLSQVKIAELTNMNQSQVSRILAGNFRKTSDHLKKICDYLCIDPKVLGRENKRLEHAIRLLWDGSVKHEKAILELLEAAAKLAHLPPDI